MIQVSIFLFTFHYMVFGKLYDIGNLNYHHPKCVVSNVVVPDRTLQSRAQTIFMKLFH